MDQQRQLVFFKHYFKDFFDPLSEKLKNKIDQVLFMIRIAEQIPTKFFKHLTGTDGLFEIRIEFQGNIYRVFCCFDEGNIVISFQRISKEITEDTKKGD